ncbi:MAG: PilZ domain-containing protein [Desulfobacteraceae bacterium]|nr:PilZ domain-containing protein [Desulfobacteraceae bacterium]
MKKNMERRLYERKNCAFPIDVDDYEAIFSGNMLNLSLGGACIEKFPGYKPDLDQELILTIPYRSKPGYLVISGKVAWRDPGGFGVRFLKKTADEDERIDLQDFLHLGA